VIEDIPVTGFWKFKHAWAKGYLFLMYSTGYPKNLVEVAGHFTIAE
jgi:hypothetical protein